MNTVTIKRLPLFRLITASSLGTVLEWYDFSLFAFLSPVLAKLFFPSHNSLIGLMETYAVFAVGFLMRPLGAILFGHYGDRFGRKNTFVFSIVLMSVATFFIGVLPTYDAISIYAPILLILLRLIQGLSAGGETTGATLFVLESVSLKNRGFIGGLVWGMTGVGMLLGSVAATWVASHTEFSWAWRIPFLLGLLTGLIAYFLRRNATESFMFLTALKENDLKEFPLKNAIDQHKKPILMALGLYILSAMITYLLFVFMPGYANQVLGLSLSDTTRISTITFLLVTLLVPVGGYLSDLVGRKNCLISSALGFVLLSYPLYFYMSHGDIDHFRIAEGFFLVLAACFQGSLTAAIFEMFPTSIRYSVTAICYNLSYAVFGGTAPFVAMYLVDFTNNKAAPGLYLTIGALFALIASIKLCTINNHICPVNSVAKS